LTDSRPFPRWFPLALLALTVLVLFHRLLFGDVLFWGLPALQFYPWREFAMSELAAGRLPLWNPYNGAGAPLLANYQSALLYPPHLLQLIFPGPGLMGILGMAHLLWAGLGIWLLAGRLRIAPLGRGIATLAFPLSSTLVARFGTLPMLEAAAWLPWLVLTVDLVIGRPRLWTFLALAAVAAMQLLVGHAQWTFYSLALAGSYGLWRVAAERRSAFRLLIVLLAVAFGAGIAAAQLLPTAELQRYSQRADGVNETSALNFSLPPVALFTLFNPDFFGNPGDGTYAVGGAYFEIAAYIGIVPVLLALIGAGRYWLGPRRKRAAPDAPPRHLTGFFSLVALFSLLLALGQYSPVYPFLYQHVPTFNLFQAPARWLLLTVFALVMLAALTAATWNPRTRLIARLGLAMGLGIALAGSIGQSVIPNLNGIARQMAQGIVVLGLLLAAAALVFALQPPPGRPTRSRWAMIVLVLIAADLGWANSRSNPTVPADFYTKLPAASARAFQADEQVNQVMFKDLLRFDDYRVAVERQAEYRRSGLPNLNLLDRRPLLNNFDPLRPDWIERFMRLMNDPARHDTLSVAAAVGTGGESRAWLVPQAVIVDSPDAAEQAVCAADWNPRRTVIVEASGERFPPGAEAGTAVITQETPLALTISLDAPGGGMLVVADAYYPGWEATIDGAPAPIYRANLAFRAVKIPPGAQTVRMVYRPGSFTGGVAISGLSLLIFAALGGIALLRRSRL
jgi:hypothetical protein